MAKDWTKIKNEYINSSISQRKLAVKYKVSFSTLRDRANKEQWNSLRNKTVIETEQKTVQKTIEKTSDVLSDLNAKVLNIDSLLLDHIKKHVIEANITTDDINKLSVSLKNAQVVHRIGEQLDKPKENDDKEEKKSLLDFAKGLERVRNERK